MPNIRHTQAKRLFDSVRAVAGDDTANELLDLLPLPKTPSEKQKAASMQASCDALNVRFDPQTVDVIRKSCHCKPSPAHVQAMKRLYESSADLRDFADHATAQANGAFRIEAHGDALRLIYPRCYCSFVKHSETQPPKAWCACSLGYAEDMFASVTSRPVVAALLKSVAQGDSECVIQITLKT